jgi:Hint domain-containing protein
LTLPVTRSHNRNDPDISVFVDDVLIPVEYLIDGRSIVQVQTGSVTYCHVELPPHAVLRAQRGYRLNRFSTMAIAANSRMVVARHSCIPTSARCGAKRSDARR